MEELSPKISVVVPSYNQGSYIEETILSIIKQNYPKLELIIIDGGSTDNSVEIIKKYSSFINYFISEKDNGQAHALNKGFAKASGDLCAYLNSDDCYLDNIFWKIRDFYLKNKFNWIYSDVLIGKSIDQSQYFTSQIVSFESFCVEQTIGQQGVFWQNNSFKKPWFDESLKYVIDHKFFINLYKNFGPPKYLSKTGAFFRIHQDSKTSKYEKILYKERKQISLEFARSANSKFQRKNIELELKRLELKIEAHKKYVLILSKSKYTEKLLCFFSILIIFLKAPFKLRDRIFLGYLKKSLISLK